MIKVFPGRNLDFSESKPNKKTNVVFFFRNFLNEVNKVGKKENIAKGEKSFISRIL